MIKSVAKSLAVKSVRIGWPEGIRAASRHFAPSEFRSILVGQVFEDVFPAPESLPEVLDEIVCCDWAALCARNTHHAAPGLTAWIMGQVPVYAARQMEMVIECRDKYGVRLPPRAAGCFGAWSVATEYAGGLREVDATPYNGVPDAVMDLHVGRWRGETILSGTLAGHNRLAGMVQSGGWDQIRGAVHGKT